MAEETRSAAASAAAAACEAWEPERKQVVVVGIDDSEHSSYALEWTLKHFFGVENHNFKLILVHAKPTAASVIGLIGPGAMDAMPIVESDLRKIVGRVLQKARELCSAFKVRNILYDALEGDPRNVLCDAVEKYDADMLVVGSHGYGVIKRAVLGSVSDYCAHHAHCTVIIVKKPKPKN